MVLAAHTRSKTAWHPSMLDALIGAAMRVGAWVPQPLPVFAGGDVIGMVHGDGQGRAAYRSCSSRDLELSGFPDYSLLDKAIRNGQKSEVLWTKNQSGDTASAWGDQWPLSGIPSAGDYSGAASTDRHFSNTTVGGFYADQRTPGAGQTRHLVGWEHATITAAALSWYGVIYDRVGSYDGQIISTVGTTFTNNTAFARYVSAGQSGLLVMPTVANTAGLDNTAATVTAITATDQNGNPGVSLLPTWPVPIYQNASGYSTTVPARVAFPHDTGISHTMTPFFPLPAGVSGVRQLTTLTCSAIYTATSTVSMVLVKPVGFIWGHYSQQVHAVNFPRTMFTLTRIMSDACLNIVSTMAAGNANVKVGRLQLAYA